MMFKKSAKMAAAGFAVLAMAGLMTGCGMSSGGDQKAAGNGQKVELKLAYQLPADHHLSKSVEKFAKEVNERSKGSIDVKVYPAGQLYNDQNMNDALMSGGLDIGLNSAVRWSMAVPALKVLDLPFVLPTIEAADNALDGDLGKTLTTELEKKNVHPLIWADYGYVQFCNNAKKIEKPEDFQGLKIRSYSETSADIIQALGASPTTMSSSEVYMAIKNGTIDGQSSGQTAILSRKIYEVCKYFTTTNHSYVGYVLAINDNSWKKLSPDQQKIVNDVAKEIRDEIRKETKSEDERCLKELAAKGMDVYTIPKDEIHLWQEATAPVVTKFEEEQGDLGKQLVEDCRKATEATQK